MEHTKYDPRELEEIVFATPIMEGRLDDVRRFCEEMQTGARAEEHGESRRRMGFRRVKVWVQRVRNRRAVLIAYWEADNIERVVREMAESQEPFDVWFREGVLEFHGVDLSQGTLRKPPERFLDWQAD